MAPIPRMVGEGWAANRLNAQKFTGPRTPEGKEKVAPNAIQDGLLDRLLVQERRIEHSLCRMLAELRQLRRQRRAVPGTPANGPTHERGTTPDQFCETNPIAKGTAAQGAAGDRSCETNPIAGGTDGSQVLSDRGVTNEAARNEHAKTKPISEAGGRLSVGRQSPPRIGVRGDMVGNLRKSARPLFLCTQE